MAKKLITTEEIEDLVRKVGGDDWNGDPNGTIYVLKNGECIAIIRDKNIKSYEGAKQRV